MDIELENEINSRVEAMISTLSMLEAVIKRNLPTIKRRSPHNVDRFKEAEKCITEAIASLQRKEVKEKYTGLIKNNCPKCDGDTTDGTGVGYYVCQKCGEVI